MPLRSVLLASITMRKVIRLLGGLVGILFVGFGIWFLVAVDEGAYRAFGAICMAMTGMHFINYGVTGRSGFRKR